MKKSILVLGILSFTVLLSCKKNEETTTTEVAAPTESTQPPTESTSTEQVTDTVPKDGTSVSISSEGVNISSKDGDKKVEVNATKEGAAVEIKK